MKKIFISLLIASLFLTACGNKTLKKELEINPNESLFSQLTYLTGLSNDFYLHREDSCKFFFQLAEVESYSPEVLQNEKVQARLLELLETQEVVDKFVSALSQKMKDGSYEVLGELCQYDGKIYVSISKDTTEIVLGLWKDGDFVLSQPIGPITEFIYLFAPGVLNGKHLVHKGYGKDGNVWWTFYSVDPETLEVERIEDCTGYFNQDEETGEFDPSLFNMTCDISYDQPSEE